jgi:hypothetical protein
LSGPETPNAVGLLRDLRAVPIFVGGVVALPGAVAAVHALVLTIRRRRDIAVLRAFGVRPRQAGSIIRWQAVIMALVAVVAGVPVGFMLGRLVWTVIAESSNVVVTTDVHVLGLVLLATAVLCITLVAAAWPAHRAARVCGRPRRCVPSSRPQAAADCSAAMRRSKSSARSSNAPEQSPVKAGACIGASVSMARSAKRRHVAPLDG